MKTRSGYVKIFGLACILAALCFPREVRGQEFTMNQTLSDEAQRTTIAFDGLAFLTGSLGSDSFFPPGKVADFWGFQYLRDNDPSRMGHNTDFLTKASLNMLQVLTVDQRQSLIVLANSQVDSINQYGHNRFVLMKAFRRLLAGDLPVGTTGLSMSAVKKFSAGLYELDGRISFQRARVMGTILHALTISQRQYLDSMVGKGMLTWPVVAEPAELQGLSHDVKVAVMTYAGDMFSWYAGSVDADVYFCPERQGTYFGSFYMKDAPAVGNPNYSIDTNLTAGYGKKFLAALSPAGAPLISDLVDIQRPYLYEIVDRRRDVSIELRKYMNGGTADSATVLTLMNRYGELDGILVYYFATRFAQVQQRLTAVQAETLAAFRKQVLGNYSPVGAYLYAEPISIPEIPNTDYLFSATRSYELQRGWNMISFPMHGQNASKTSLFPSAVSPAFAYNGEYLGCDTLTAGNGYWLKFASNQSFTVPTDGYDADTITLREGWNLIGALGISSAVTNIISDSPGVTLSPFYAYDAGYSRTEVLDPCRGYWVKSSTACRIFLGMGTVTGNTHAVSARDNGDAPPAAPDVLEASSMQGIDAFALLPNYPNPFNPSTLIQYHVPKESRVKITVTNVLGQVVSVLVDGMVETGTHAVEWNAESMAGGIYFCRIEARPVENPGEHFAQARKLLLMK